RARSCGAGRRSSRVRRLRGRLLELAQQRAELRAEPRVERIVAAQVVLLARIGAQVEDAAAHRRAALEVAAEDQPLQRVLRLRDRLEPVADGPLRQDDLEAATPRRARRQALAGRRAGD